MKLAADANCNQKVVRRLINQVPGRGESLALGICPSRRCFAVCACVALATRLNPGDKLLPSLASSAQP